VAQKRPIGVATKTAKHVMMTLPTIAFLRPPTRASGAGVSFKKKSKLRAENPCLINAVKIDPKIKIPKTTDAMHNTENILFLRYLTV
jgi:hypothetical protein